MTAGAAATLARARAAFAEGRRAAAEALARAAAAAEGAPGDRFEALLLVGALAGGRPDGALDAVAVYEEAGRLARDARLERAGEADLGLAVALTDLGRVGESRAALRRAALAFRGRGHSYLRGCAEVLLACEALDATDTDAAGRHLDLASDLLGAADEPRMLSILHLIYAELRIAEGDADAARAELGLAAGTALRLDDDALRAQLAARRQSVRKALARALSTPD